jgi:undecaprenyl-diphosphatase
MRDLDIYGQALLLAILQGLTEFLPISSSAHLILLPWMCQWENPLIDSLLFDVALHLGTLLAILWYFRADWWELAKAGGKLLIHHRIDPFSTRLFVYILLASIPAAVAGLSLEKYIESVFRNPILIVIPLILVSFLMLQAERKARQEKGLNRLDLRHAFLIGLAQALALFPGVSRSGITITAGLFLGYQREAVTRFSFLLSTPAIAGAALLQFRHLFRSGIGTEWPVFALGILISAFVGYAAIAFLLRYLRNHTLNLFAGYRLVLAGFTIFFILWRR